MSDAASAADSVRPPEEAGNERCIIWHRCAQGAEPEPREAWLRTAFTRMEVAGGEPLALSTGNLVFGFDSLDLDDVVDLALGLAREAAQTGEVHAASAVGLGPIRRAETNAELPWWLGSVIDRAEALARSLSHGEVALDGAAHERVAERYLFMRRGAAHDATGHLLDTTHPHTRACREALRSLAAPPLAPGALPTFERLRAALSGKQARRISLRSIDPDEPLDWVTRLRNEHAQPPSLRIAKQAGGLQPLGALQLALRRRRMDGTDWKDLDSPHGEVLDSMLAGRATDRTQTGAALVALLQADALHSAPDTLPWVVVERLHELDPASLHVIAALLQAGQPAFTLCMTLPPDARVPTALLRGGENVELRIAPPSAPDRCVIAERTLGLPRNSSIAQRIAQLSGPSARGVVEATRTLVTSGDLVRDGASFVWRAGPRGPGVPLPVDAWLSERLKGLSPDSHRVLEALCIASPDLERLRVDAIVALDGLDSAASAAGRAQLVDEGWIDAGGSLVGAAHLVSTVRSNMPPARAAELHRFAARVVNDSIDGGFALGLVAYHQAEGEHTSEAARSLLETARAAGESGFDKSAVRLAGAALQLDESPANQELAGQLARAYQTSGQTNATDSQDSSEASAAPAAARPAGTERTHVAQRAMRTALRALLESDFETAEGLLDTALASGWNAAAVARVRSVSRLGQGDIGAAIRALQDARNTSKADDTKLRLHLAEALILMRCGSVEDAICTALGSLATCLRDGDKRGERAALHVIAAGYRQLSRSDDAARIERRAATAAV